PIKDMNDKQWNRVEGRVIAALREVPHLNDSEVAVLAMDEVFGKTDSEGVIKPPKGGYTTELLDGVTRMAQVRRKQVGAAK
ncbi:MAG: hypothetical protein ACPGYS_07105, partial [Flavobacteriales bacterium]